MIQMTLYAVLVRQRNARRVKKTGKKRAKRSGKSEKTVE